MARVPSLLGPQIVEIEVEKQKSLMRLIEQSQTRRVHQLGDEAKSCASQAREASRRGHLKEAELLRQRRNKMLVKQYAQHKSDLQQQQAQSEEELKAMASFQQNHVRQCNAGRVQHRRLVLDKKREDLHQRELDMLEEQNAREDRLARLRALVSRSQRAS
jgi:selenocysteine-specific translation elongation factor